VLPRETARDTRIIGWAGRALRGRDHRQGQSGIAFLLSDRRQDASLAIPDFNNGLVGIAAAVSVLDAMDPFDGDLVHFDRF
jgi:hypothetical protein